MVHLITGYAGKPHVTSSSDGAVNMGMYGKGKYILNIGEKFGYEIVSNNIIKIKSGYAINQGRKIEIAINDYEEVTIDNGLQGMKRCDLIVLRYEKSPDSGIETASLAVIKGISSDTYVAPTYSEGDILAGEGIDDFLLYKVFISGLSIEKVETQFTVTKSIMEILDEYKKMPSELDRMLGSLNTLSKYTTVHTPNPSIGPQIIQKENTESDIETGKPFPFPIQTVVEGHELALRQLNTDTKILPVLNGEMRKIKFCAGTVYVRFDSNAFANITMDDYFASATPIINVLGYPDIFNNASVYDNVIIVDVHKEHANQEAYVRYLVIGF